MTDGAEADPSTEPGENESRDVGDGKPQKSRRVSEQSLNRAVADLRLGFQYDRTFWEAVAAGVSLGAEEVQDQRLVRAENPPAADADDVMLLLVMFALEAPAATRLVGAVQSQVVAALRKRMRLQQLSYRAALLNATTVERADLERAQRIAQRAGDKLRRREASRKALGGKRQPALRKAERDSELANAELMARGQALATAQGRVSLPSGYATAVQAVKGLTAAGEGPEYVTAALKTVLPEKDKLAETAARMIEPRPMAASPGVALRASVAKQKLRLDNDSHYLEEEWVLHLRNDGTERVLDEMYEALQGGDAVDLDYIVDYYQVLTAAVIWSQLLDVGGLAERRKQELSILDNQTFVMESALSPTDMLPLQEITLFGSKGLEDYLVARFGDAAEAWARDNPGRVVVPSPGVSLDDYLQAGREPKEEPDGVLASVLAAITEPLITSPQELRLDLVMQWLGALQEVVPPELAAGLPRRVITPPPRSESRDAARTQQPAGRVQPPG